MIKRIIPVKKMQPQLIPIGGSVEVHAKSLASFKAVSSKWNKDKADAEKIAFEYSDFTGEFCKATRVIYKPKKSEPCT